MLAQRKSPKKCAQGDLCRGGPLENPSPPAKGAAAPIGSPAGVYEGRRTEDGGRSAPTFLELMPLSPVGSRLGTYEPLPGKTGGLNVETLISLVSLMIVGFVAPVSADASLLPLPLNPAGPQPSSSMNIRTSTISTNNVCRIKRGFPLDHRYR